MKMVLETKGIGKNGLFELRNQLNNFVDNNWCVLYEGALRLGFAIEADYYAPERVQINNTRLHASIGLKYADEHKYSDGVAPTEKQLRQTIQDLQTLLDEAGENVDPPFTLSVIER